jgi:hypothetical protein
MFITDDKCMILKEVSDSEDDVYHYGDTTFEALLAARRAGVARRRAERLAKQEKANAE